MINQKPDNHILLKVNEQKNLEVINLRGSGCVEARVQKFRDLVNTENININFLREATYRGLPDTPNTFLRATVWKILLNLLPHKRSLWPIQLKEKRQLYKQLCEEHLPNNRSGKLQRSTCNNDGEVQVGDSIQENSHPLAQKTNGKWSDYFKDNQTLEQIERDVLRTHPDLHFFSSDNAASQNHRQEILRALFIFAKLNPGIRYVQGMNEIFAVLYYVFKHDKEAEAQHAEADSLFCFIEMMSEFRDLFCHQLDSSSVGVKATINHLSQLLQFYDYQLWDHLENVNKVDPQYFAFRWITLLLTQELDLPDILRLWDTLLSDPLGKKNCLIRVCASMIILAKDDLMRGSFSDNIKFLQRYPITDLKYILDMAEKLISYESKVHG